MPRKSRLGMVVGLTVLLGLLAWAVFCRKPSIPPEAPLHGPPTTAGDRSRAATLFTEIRVELGRKARDPGAAGKELARLEKKVANLEAVGYPAYHLAELRAQIAYLRGDFTSADRWARKALQAAGEEADPHDRVHLNLMRLDVALREARMNRARALVDEIYEQLRANAPARVAYQVGAELLLVQAGFFENPHPPQLEEVQGYYEAYRESGWAPDLFEMRHDELIDLVTLGQDRLDTGTGQAEQLLKLLADPPREVPPFVSLYVESICWPMAVASGYLKLGDLHRQAGRDQRARLYYRKALEYRPGYRPLKTRLKAWESPAPPRAALPRRYPQALLPPEPPCPSPRKLLSYQGTHQGEVSLPEAPLVF